MNSTSTVRSTRPGQARAKAAERAAAPRRVEQGPRRVWRAAAVVVALALAGGGLFLATRDGGGAGSASAAAPAVGGDLHTISAIGDTLYVGGHAAVAVSRDGGGSWEQVPSLAGSDAMGWAVTPDAVLVGGHPGLYLSTDSGATFARVSDAARDVHALGGSGSTVYLSSPEAGLLASSDGGRSWQVRNAQGGRSFMGTIQVDPQNPQRLLAPDMSTGMTLSSDGGRTFTPLGGPAGAMAATWNPTDVDDIIAVGMDSGARSTDGGQTWRDLTLPKGTTAVTYSDDGATVYAAALQGQKAVTYRSTDAGASWSPTT